MPGLGTHKKSCPDLTHEPAARTLSPDLNEVMVQHEPTARMLSPDLNEVMVQHLTPACRANAYPNNVRVQLSVFSNSKPKTQNSKLF